MKKPCFVFLITAALGLGLFAAGGQEKKEKPAGAEEFAPPKPGPEHEILKQSEGVWDASGEFRFAPDATTVTSKGA